MKQKNLQIAVAALALGVQMASPATAGIRHHDLTTLSTAVALGQEAEIGAVLGQSPDLARAVARVGERDGLVVLAKGSRGVGQGEGGGRENNRGVGQGEGGGRENNRGKGGIY